MNDDMNKRIGEIVARCWADEAFKQRLLADPNATLRAEGIAVPEGVSVNVVENSDRVVHYVLPRDPNAELSDADLAAAAGGKDPYGSQNQCTKDACRLWGSRFD